MRLPATAAATVFALIAIGFPPLQAQAQQSPATSQQPGVLSDADLQKEAITANSLYQKQNMIAALPLYEDLHTRQPDSNLWRERLGMCLITARGSDAEIMANVARAHQLFLDAKAAGDNSNLLQTVLEKLEAPAAPAPTGPPSPGLAAFRQAETAFKNGDLPTALKFYQQAAETDPKLYEAPLYAGDTEFKQGHYAEADRWYAQAAAINPNRETAFRYWGDCLMKQNDPTQAEAKFIEAIIAEPYTRTPRLGLKQWADQTKALLVAPPITLPTRPKITTSDKDGFITNMTVGIDAAVMDASKDSPMLPAIMAYEMGSPMWRGSMFHKTYPTETQYRHSLGEEAQSIRIALSTLTKANLPTDKWDATWRTLAQIDADGMLECWILLDHADQGIAQDYVAYRAAHRELLHAYIAKYDIHRN